MFSSSFSKLLPNTRKIDNFLENDVNAKTNEVQSSISFSINVFLLECFSINVLLECFSYDIVFWALLKFGRSLQFKNLFSIGPTNSHHILLRRTFKRLDLCCTSWRAIKLPQSSMIQFTFGVLIYIYIYIYCGVACSCNGQVLWSNFYWIQLTSAHRVFVNGSF